MNSDKFSKTALYEKIIAPLKAVKAAAGSGAKVVSGTTGGTDPSRALARIKQEFLNAPPNKDGMLYSNANSSVALS